MVLFDINGKGLTLSTINGVSNGRTLSLKYFNNLFLLNSSNSLLSETNSIPALDFNSIKSDFNNLLCSSNILYISVLTLLIFDFTGSSFSLLFNIFGYLTIVNSSKLLDDIER